MSGDYFIGLISGTSRDGMDSVLVNMESGLPEILTAICVPYPTAINESLDQLLATPMRPSPESTFELDRQLGHFIARTCRDLMQQAGLEPADIGGIGSHGQTVWHEPDGDDPVSIQLGSGHIIANVTRAPTVTRFRDADVAAGGQGAPLAPLLHKELFANSSHTVGVLNLGGISNLTLLHPDGTVAGFDCGPANCLMDRWASRHLGKAYDEGGEWAASGQINSELLDTFLAEPYFAIEPPKSTGIEKFNDDWLDKHHLTTSISAADVQATLAELTAITIKDSIEVECMPAELLVCGGGVHNAYLLERLAHHLPDVEIASTARRGINPDWVEACLFAWLGYQRLRDNRMETGPITGAAKAVLLGQVNQPGG